jgi:hypothetical protein
MSAVEGIVAALLAILATLAAGWLIQRDRARHGPAVRRLAAALGVRGEQRRLLAAMARAAGLPHPGSLLVCEGAFDAAAEKLAGRPADRAAIAHLRQTLFAA